jgi:hypothetical protein
MTARLSDAEWDRLAKGFQVGQIAKPAKGQKRSKYNARAVLVTVQGLIYPAQVAIAQGIQGIRFDSQREAQHYVTLLGLLERGTITGLTLQPSFDIHAADGTTKVATYRADFSYVDVASGTVIVVDVKGMKTPIYRLKKKLVEAEHHIAIREV